LNETAITQIGGGGANNSATIVQAGNGNYASTRQVDSGNVSTITRNGNNNHASVTQL